nr:hypothetical protein [Streptococcus gallolyticus]
MTYRDALTSAQTILSEKHTQAEVDDALANLKAAEKALDGQEIIEDTDVQKEESLIPEKVIKPETAPKVDPQVSENEKARGRNRSYRSQRFNSC